MVHCMQSSAPKLVSLSNFLQNHICVGIQPQVCFKLHLNACPKNPLMLNISKHKKFHALYSLFNGLLNHTPGNVKAPIQRSHDKAC